MITDTPGATATGLACGGQLRCAGPRPGYLQVASATHLLPLLLWPPPVAPTVPPGPRCGHGLCGSGGRKGGKAAAARAARRPRSSVGMTLRARTLFLRYLAWLP